MIVVNGQFPGPAIRANEDDIVIVNVTNLVAAPVTIHWLKALLTGLVFVHSQLSYYILSVPSQTEVWRKASRALSKVLFVLWIFSMNSRNYYLF